MKDFFKRTEAELEIRSQKDKAEDCRVHALREVAWQKGEVLVVDYIKDNNITFRDFKKLILLYEQLYLLVGMNLRSSTLRKFTSLNSQAIERLNWLKDVFNISEDYKAIGLSNKYKNQEWAVKWWRKYHS